VTVELILSQCPIYTPPQPCSNTIDTVFVPEVEFNWHLAEQGFRESFSLFLVIFAAYCIVKVLNLALK
jgi:hypothetical protein